MAESVHRQRLARGISILCHPVPLMAVASAVATGAGAPSGLQRQVLASVALAAGAVMLYSVAKARSGRWAHIDASQRHERAEFNRFASWLFFGLALALAAAGAHRDVVVAVALPGAIVLGGRLLHGRLKSSLHVAFAAFAAGIAWPHALASGLLLAAMLAVAWSRWVLGRHVAAELLSGAGLGLAAGVAFQVTTRA
ncbi:MULTISPECIES: hypothetical protein [unclassified Luteimonas]|uniref:hypothetical protein n=1 Tax=unclassified Luteimonas TaxID=2629088 RepID=UPI0018F0A96E|nr:MULTISPECIES: hypothetical protein [unclassified Luteimonas]MBJ6979362.1 hypothetical protein [Luteimonas sp. MC1895]MBJ6984423.1 hypothetical protein [Luteimonas sp. MC1750]QQO04960.1 hypothetical protein JGR68_08700 [Luteimonas sp. MC1750]